jgi:hypothetical protein
MESIAFFRTTGEEFWFVGLAWVVGFEFWVLGGVDGAGLVAGGVLGCGFCVVGLVAGGVLGCEVWVVGLVCACATDSVVTVIHNARKVFVKDVCMF